MKILIIDDDPEALEITKLRLTKEPLNVLCADGGTLGLEVARRENPDLILLDVDMPDMSGYDVCRALKSDRDSCMIPVLFLTCSSDANDTIRGLDCGAVDYITKPFDPPQLRARVRAAIRTKRVQDILIEYIRFDPVSGMSNHRMLMDRLKSEWSCCTGSGRGHEPILAQ